MPGGRLTQEDRRLVADGLAEGLGYAEIARQLGRPTSTVSREVARNGGPDGYQADGAHQATERRARRSRPAASAQPQGAVDADGRDLDAVLAYAEQFAALMVQTGLPRMAARVFARLFTTDSASLTAAELARDLRVSPASVSKAVGYLEGIEVVRRERDPRSRRERYVIDDDVWFGAWQSSARSTGLWADAARQGAEILGSGTAAGARMAQMSDFFGRLSDDMTGGPAVTVAVNDAMAVLAALVQAGVALTVDQIAGALDWPVDRVASALHEADQHPEITDPVVLRRVVPGTYTIEAKPDRLTKEQRDAVDQLRRQAASPSA